MKHTVDFEQQIECPKETQHWIETAVNSALDYENIDFPCEIDITIVDEDEIRQINSEYREIDKVTDVLSFPLYENAEEARADAMPDGEKTLLGDMILCLPKAVQQAEEYGHSLQREISFLSVHSVLHLLGYDHELGNREESEMFQKQHEILDKMGIKRG